MYAPIRSMWSIQLVHLRSSSRPISQCLLQVSPSLPFRVPVTFLSNTTNNLHTTTTRLLWHLPSLHQARTLYRIHHTLCWLIDLSYTLLQPPLFATQWIAFFNFKHKLHTFLLQDDLNLNLFKTCLLSATTYQIRMT